MEAQEEHPSTEVWLANSSSPPTLGDALGRFRLKQGLWSLGGMCPGVPLAEHPAAEITLPYGPGLM